MCYNGFKGGEIMDTKYKNEYNRNNYDRINLVVPKGQKDILKKQCDDMGMSINEYIKLLIQDDMKTGSSRLKDKMTGFTEEQYIMMDKWQVPTKYRDMIEDLSYSKEEGYFIRLKKGFINDVTGSRVITAKKSHDIRLIINKSHKI